LTEQNFKKRREASWKEFESLIRGSGKKIRAGAASFPRCFREITQDLNTARSHGFDPALVERLNRLVYEGNQILYSQHDWSLKTLANFVLYKFPQSVRDHKRGFAAALLLFYGLAFFTGIICVRQPEMVYDFLGETQAAGIEGMYDPSAGHFLKPRDTGSDADMFAYYIYNNISIAFRTFAGGIFAGIGSLVILCVNAVVLGASAGHIINKGFSNTFFTFVIAHSGFELTAVILSAQGGFLLGYRFFITKGLSRGASVKEAGKDALPIITGSALMLVIAASIEAFWSSRFTLPPALRLGVGAALWVLLGCYFIFSGRKDQKP
jgi:uncharacterized membrane protein SpoIIM required for sporulation